MYLGLEELGHFFHQRRDHARLVLATVVTTAGSTYRKAGAMMLFAEDGTRAGLVSGSCLEDDLAGHAAKVFASNRPRRVNYDLHDDPDLVLGLGLGCGGDLSLQLHPLNHDQGMNVLGSMFDAIAAGKDCRLLQFLSDGEGAELEGDGIAVTGSEGLAAGQSTLLETGSEHRTDDTPAVFALPISPPPRVLVCGAGPDAVPLAAQVRALGWRCLVLDHRAAYADPARFASGVDVWLQRPGTLAQAELETIDAAIIMSHHVEHDLAYLRCLSAHPPAWVGLLGPAKRKATLLERLGENTMTVYGPAGLDIGAEMPAAVALSIVAAIHAHMHGRDGMALGHG
ncbi:XdhC family protein [Marinihelvus fidelis]|nr:XdhC/CoxI family protein [Marinihelvus fidelis]